MRILNRQQPPSVTKLVPAKKSNSFDWGKVDKSLLFVILALLALSAIMIYTSSVALVDNGRALSTGYYLDKFFKIIALSLVLVLIVVQVPMETWQNNSAYLAVVTVLLLVGVLLVGVEIRGARRWINLIIMNFQPAELAKMAMVLYASGYVVRKIRSNTTTKFWHAVMPMAGVVTIFGVLLLLEPDLGSTIVIAVIAIAILFMGGVKLTGIFVISFFTIAVSALSIYITPWRRERVLAFLDPWQSDYALGKGYQLTHSLIALGRGEISGVGLGLGIEKFNWLPDAHTDFIFAVIGEELGYIGVVVVVVMYWFLISKIVRIASIAVRRDEVFSGLVVFGIATWLSMQILFHMGVNLGLLPTKGLTLPLMSYGGSGLIMNLIALAMVFRVDFENKLVSNLKV